MEGVSGRGASLVMLHVAGVSGRGASPVMSYVGGVFGRGRGTCVGSRAHQQPGVSADWCLSRNRGVCRAEAWYLVDDCR